MICDTCGMRLAATAATRRNAVARAGPALCAYTAPACATLHLHTHCHHFIAISNAAGRQIRASASAIPTARDFTICAADAYAEHAYAADGKIPRGSPRLTVLMLLTSLAVRAGLTAKPHQQQQKCCVTKAHDNVANRLRYVFGSSSYCRRESAGQALSKGHQHRSRLTHNTVLRGSCHSCMPHSMPGGHVVLVLPANSNKTLSQTTARVVAYMLPFVRGSWTWRTVQYATICLYNVESRLQHGLASL